MNHSKPVEASAGAVRRMWERHGIKEPIRFLGFCLSLLPVPVIQQAGQVLDRHLSDQDFEKRLSKIWAQIKGLNKAVARVATLEESIAEIAKTIRDNPSAEADVRDFIRSLGIHQKEFVAISEEKSYHEFLNSVILAESAYFLTRSGSTTAIEDSNITTERTTLHSTGGSRNYVNNTTFQGLGGAVSMHDMSTQGSIRVEGSSVSFGPGGALIFGGNPYLVSGSCPFCNQCVQVDRRRLVGYGSIQCPSCHRIVPFKLPNF